MERYVLTKLIGEGTGGTVCKAVQRDTGKFVAIKRIKGRFSSWEECMNLGEFQVLRRLNHANIIRLEEVIQEHDMVYLVLEYMEHDLKQIIKERREPFTELEARKLCFQLLCGLDHMHSLSYFHRDLKPANLLVTKDTIKVADFGLARELDSSGPYTDYVVTRWYRAPEVLLKKDSYDAAIDMWAMGTIMAELFTLKPLFPGNSEVDQVYKICKVIGTPRCSTWPDGIKLAESLNLKFPQVSSTGLSYLIPTVGADAITLIAALCSWDPSKRPTAAQALAHPFFQARISVPPSILNVADVRKRIASSTWHTVQKRITIEKELHRQHGTQFRNEVQPMNEGVLLPNMGSKTLKQGVLLPNMGSKTLKQGVLLPNMGTKILKAGVLLPSMGSF